MLRNDFMSIFMRNVFNKISHSNRRVGTHFINNQGYFGGYFIEYHALICNRITVIYFMEESMEKSFRIIDVDMACF